MNGGLDGHTMPDRPLIGSVRGRNKHSRGIYIGVKVWHFQEKRETPQPPLKPNPLQKKKKKDNKEEDDRLGETFTLF